METKKLIGAAAFSLALVGGGVAGAIIGTPGTSGAQESTTTADTTDTADRPREGRHADLLEAAATALGMTADELRAELEADKTIADVAGERGVELQTVIEAVVAAGEDEHVERVTAFVNGERPEGGFGRGGHRHGMHIGLEAAATALDMTADELREALSADGATLASVAEAQGVDVQVVIDALVAEAQEHLDQAVADGRLTQEEADEKAADLEARITEMVNSERPDGPGPGFRGGRRP
jgi:hypothetical protein